MTQPTLDNAEPADIVGLDGNCAFKTGFYGEHWAPDAWKQADYGSVEILSN